MVTLYPKLLICAACKTSGGPSGACGCGGSLHRLGCGESHPWKVMLAPVLKTLGWVYNLQYMYETISSTNHGAHIFELKSITSSSEAISVKKSLYSATEPLKPSWNSRIDQDWSIINFMTWFSSLKSTSHSTTSFIANPGPGWPECSWRPYTYS